jgi:hypothetical protein
MIVMMKLLQQEKVISNVYSPNIRALKFIKQVLMDLK